MTPIPAEKIHTIDDIYALPDGTRAELIDGKLYDMAPPGRIHQEISIYLSSEIYHYIRSQKGKCRVFTAPFAVFPDADDITYVEPDISLYTFRHSVKSGVIRGLTIDFSDLKLETSV